MANNEEIRQFYRYWEYVDQLAIYKNNINRCKNMLYLKLCLFAFIYSFSRRGPAFHFIYNGFALNVYRMFNNIYG